MARSADRDPVFDVVGDFVLAAQIKQHRLSRLFGDEHEWSLDVDAGVWRIGRYEGRLDVLGTVGANDTFLWAWVNPTFSDATRLTSMMLRRVGHQWEMPALVHDGEIPVAVVDGHVAGIIGVGIGEADGYYLGHHDDGAVVFLLRHHALRHEPCRIEDVLPVLNMLAAGEFPVEPRAALQALADEPPPGLIVEVGDRGAALTAPGGRALVELDRRGRVGKVAMDANADVVGAPLETPEPDDLTEIGTLDLPAGGVVIYDPLAAPDAMFAQPRAGALPAGTYPVAVELDVEDGDTRVAVAHLVLGDGDVDAWYPVGSVIIDSGVVAFAAPETAAALPAIALDERGDTWRAGAIPGAVATAIGVGAGEYELLWGLSATDELIRIAVHALPEPEGETDPPAPGMQRAALLPLHAGGDLSAPNVLPLTPAGHTALSGAQRQMLVAALTHDGDLEVEGRPEYEGTDPTPVRIHFRAGDVFDETVELPR